MFITGATGNPGILKAVSGAPAGEQEQLDQVPAGANKGK